MGPAIRCHVEVIVIDEGTPPRSMAIPTAASRTSGSISSTSSSRNVGTCGPRTLLRLAGMYDTSEPVSYRADLAVNAENGSYPPSASQCRKSWRAAKTCADWASDPPRILVPCPSCTIELRWVAKAAR